MLVFHQSIMKMDIFSLLVRAALLAVAVVGQTTDVEELARMNADFATRLYSKIASSNDDNVAVSTLGATLALATLAAGAGGAARTELLQGIGVASMQKEGEPERIQTLLQQLRETTAQIQATGLFMKQDIKADDSFSKQVKQFYDADVQNVNYANEQLAKESIDNYVRAKTGEKVKNVVENVEPQSVAMVISGAFFTGKRNK